MNPYQMKKEDVLKMLGTDENGLTQNQAKENQKSTAKTNLRRVKEKSVYIVFGAVQGFSCYNSYYCGDYIRCAW